MPEYEIVKLNINEYEKCNNIWDMKRCPFTEQFRKQIITGDRQVFIYKIGDAFIGEGALVENHNDRDYFIAGQRIYLSRMIVKKEYRNQGIGAIILDYLIAQAKQMGYKEMALGVDIDNIPALALYRKNGFHTVLSECEDEYGRFYKLLKKL